MHASPIKLNDMNCQNASRGRRHINETKFCATKWVGKWLQRLARKRTNSEIAVQHALCVNSDKQKRLNFDSIQLNDQELTMARDENDERKKRKRNKRDNARKTQPTYPTRFAVGNGHLQRG